MRGGAVCWARSNSPTKRNNHDSSLPALTLPFKRKAPTHPCPFFFLGITALSHRLQDERISKLGSRVNFKKLSSRKITRSRPTLQPGSLIQDTSIVRQPDINICTKKKRQTLHPFSGVSQKCFVVVVVKSDLNSHLYSLFAKFKLQLDGYNTPLSTPAFTTNSTSTQRTTRLSI